MPRTTENSDAHKIAHRIRGDRSTPQKTDMLLHITYLRDTQFGGGKGSSTTSCEQLGASGPCFAATGTDGLSNTIIMNCIKILLYNIYPHATHQPTAGPAHDCLTVCDTIANLHVQFRRAADGDFAGPIVSLPETLRSSLEASWQSPSLVGDGAHFRVVCIDS